VLLFDIPFLCTRASILGVINPVKLWKILVRYPVYLDIYQLLGDSFMAFARWKKLWIGQTGPHTGKDVPDLYYQKRYEEIVEYVNDKLDSLEHIYYSITKEPFYQELLKLREQAKTPG
jgi:hypothetical protein